MTRRARPVRRRALLVLEDGGRLRLLGSDSVRHALRALLRRAMHAEGFAVYAPEWWHFDHAGWREYPVLNLRLDVP